jgi:hypothetical protein
MPARSKQSAPRGVINTESEGGQWVGSMKHG